MNDVPDPAAPQNGLFSDGEWAEVLKALGLPRQKCRVLAMLLEALEDKQIATRLGIGVPTVRSHMTGIFKRLGVADRAELVLHVFLEFRRGCGDCPRRQRRCHQH